MARCRPFNVDIMLTNVTTLFQEISSLRVCWEGLARVKADDCNKFSTCVYHFHLFILTNIFQRSLTSTLKNCVPKDVNVDRYFCINHESVKNVQECSWISVGKPLSKPLTFAYLSLNITCVHPSKTFSYTNFHLFQLPYLPRK